MTRLLLLVALASLSGGARATEKTVVGTASWYGPGFHGKRTASGTRFNRYAMTLACRALPLGSRVIVTNLANGKSVAGTITDRGPWTRGRVADVSEGMARRLGFHRKGVTRVRVRLKGAK